MILACVPFWGKLIIILGGGVPPGPENPYPISDQNIWFTIHYFRPNNFHPVFSSICHALSALTHFYMLSQAKNTKLIPYFRPKRQTLYPISECLKTIPFGVAHTYIYMGVLPPPPGSHCCLTSTVISLLWYVGYTRNTIIADTPSLRPALAYIRSFDAKK